ncbi:MAG: YkgJ family cysteine cluster protein [Candidatus Diapherotrites archaeon]|uniref:YkgJ family cysteine cluster protein n=1 Tax=Candidatus Iainarchaeum sp. TaxID=3101447 RepID=A0A8T4C7T2_9ARCH|nr:YkgJ family cysteine cluster protein [Candidatus Diapherotrites archaeon]
MVWGPIPRMNPPSAEQIYAICKTCGECCKRYAISVLPRELAREAKFFKLSEKEFTAIYTRLLVQIVPFSSGQHPLSLHTSMIPQNVWKKLQAAGFSSDYAMILPMVGFKKKEYCVFFDPKTTSCTMHEVKPAQCTLFPFTSVEKNIDYAKAYDFCELSRVEKPTNEIFAAQDAQRVEMRNYFDAVAEKGLSNVWKNIPNAGDIIYNGKIISTITLNELNEWLAAAKNK